MKSYVEQMNEAGPDGFDAVLQKALSEMSDKINEILRDTHPIDQPLLAAALHLASQAILSQTVESGRDLFNLTLEQTAAMAIPAKRGR